MRFGIFSTIAFSVDVFLENQTDADKRHDCHQENPIDIYKAVNF